jgi:hypothetical protein
MMAGKPIGTIYAELDLDTTKYTKAQQQILKDASVVTLDIEKNYKNLGIKSGSYFDLFRAQAENSYQGILHSSKSTSNDIIRAEEAKQERLKQLDEQQYGRQTSFLNSLKENWLAVTGVVIAGIAMIEGAYTSSRATASMLNDIERQSQLVGVSTDQWQKWSYAAKMSDSSADSLLQSLRLLSTNIVEAKKPGTEMEFIFRQLKITANDLQGVFYQLSDRFASMKDGPDKIALGTKLMGRGIMDIIPLMNQGSSGIKEFGDKARIAGQDLIDSGKRAEDSFKNWDEALKHLKLSSAPMIEIFAKILEKMGDIIAQAPKVGETLSNAFVKAYEMGINPETGLPFKVPNVGRTKAVFGVEEGVAARIATENGPSIDFDKWKAEMAQSRKDAEELGRTWMEAYTKGLEIGYTKIEESYIFDKTKQAFIQVQKAVEAMGIPEGGEYGVSKEGYELKKYLEEVDLEFNKFMGTVQEASDSGKMASWEDALFQPIKKAIPDVKALDLAFAQLIAEVDRLSQEGKMPSWEDALWPEHTITKNGQIVPFQKFIDEADRMNQFWTGIATNMGQSFTSGFFNIFKDGLSDMGSAFEQFGLNLLNSFSNIVQQLVANWIMFGSIMGASGFAKGASYGGILGMFGLTGAASGFEGMVNSPTMFKVAEGGEPEYVSVTPKSKMRKDESNQGGTVNAFYIYALDPMSWRDFVRRNPEPIIETYSRDARVAGATRSVIRGEQ